MKPLILPNRYDWPRTRRQTRGKEFFAADERRWTLIDWSRGRLIGSTRGSVIAISSVLTPLMSGRARSMPADQRPRSTAKDSAKSNEANDQVIKQAFLSQRNKEGRSSPPSRKVVALRAKVDRILARSAKILASPCTRSSSLVRQW